MKIKRKKPPKPSPQNRGMAKALDKQGGGRGFRRLLREFLADESSPDSPKWRLIQTALRRAETGDFFFWQKLVDLHEAETVNADDLHEFIEKIYGVVRRHVEKLEGGKDCLAQIARDLQAIKV